jgi:hypothetical protein
MLRHIMITGTALCLATASSLAHADHDRELRYVVGGAILGAALGELAYASGPRGGLVVDYGAPYGYRYGYRPGIVYAPPRYFARPVYPRHWRHDRHFGNRWNDRGGRRHRH